jgi:hypothetical protein
MEVFDRMENLMGSLKDYVDVRLERIKLSVAGKLSALAANLLAAIFVCMMATMVIVFLSVALALYLGELFGHAWTGFLAVAGVYLLLAAITWLMKGKWIRMPIMNGIIAQLTKPEDDEEDEE